MRSTNELLHTRPTDALSSQGREAKASLIRRRNVIVSARSANAQTIVAYTEISKQLGFTPLELQSVFFAMAYYFILHDIALPEGKKKKQERGKIIDTFLSNAQITLDDSCQTIIFFGEDTSQLVSNEVDQSRVEVLAGQLWEDSAILGRVVGFIKLVLEQQVSLLVLQQCSSNMNGDGVRISAGANIREANQGTNFADHAITSPDPKVIHFGLLRETVRQTQYEERRRQLQAGIESGEVPLRLRFELHNWSTDHLMQHVRAQVVEATTDFIKINDFLCDPQDLKYQVLFRLTTFSVSQVFNQGEKLEEYLDAIGVYDHWSNILQVDAKIISRFTLNQSLLHFVIEEQAKIIADRLDQSPLPIREILTPTGIFAEPGWVIARRNGDIYAVQEEGSAHSAIIPLDLREIDPDYAKQVHGDLHYIHTPRADLAFGLYVRGEPVPFSVLALDRIDRPYKQNVLLAQGYDPRRCYDLTRLYSKPGTPGNTSSSFFALIFRYLRKQYPEIQAIVSAFMPSYATGVSMTSGGFDNPIMIKTLRHTFAPTVTSDGSIAYEHVTRRRHSSSETDKFIANKFPLLPTIELMTKLRKPRFEPLPDVEKKMIEIRY